MTEKIKFIYMTTNLINGKKYIGQHTGYLNDSYLGSGTTLKQAIAKYGANNFQRKIIEICKTQEQLDQREKYWITKYNAIEDNNYYNNAEGGMGGDGWRACHRWKDTHPEEAQKIYYENGQRLQNWIKAHPEETQCHIQKMLTVSHQYYKNHPDKQKELMKKVNEAKQKWQAEHPEEHAAQVQSWILSGSKANSKQVKCITTGKIFESISAAARYYNTQQSNISKVLQGTRRSAGKNPDTGEKLEWEWYQPANKI